MGRRQQTGFTPQGYPQQPAAPPAPPESGAGKRRSSPAKPRRKGSRAQLIGAAVLALAAGLIVVAAIAGQGAATVYVAHTAQTVNAQSQVTASMLEGREAIVDENLTGMISDGKVFAAETPQGAVEVALENLAGFRTQYPIRSGERLHLDDFSAEAATVDRPLQPDERLVSVQASVARAASGMLRAGDRIDVLGLGDGVAGVIATNVEIVSVTLSESRYEAAVSGTSDDPDVTRDELLPGDPVPGMYLLRADAALAQRLVAVDRFGELVFLYRPAEANSMEPVIYDYLEVICGRDYRLQGGESASPTALPDICTSAGTGRGEPFEEFQGLE